MVDQDAETGVLEILRALSPQGFEHFCKRLLRESGFCEVHVTGKVGDEGIDGYGTLEINALVSFKVLFQCKRYKGSVGAPEVRDFRGAMLGRADKGIILTTGTFTADAKREASRDGVPPVELIDGLKLVGLMENLELGVSPRIIYEPDHKFFDQFRQA
ncbi:MAG: restriction endonuclease [Erythrobacter sp.]